MYQVDDTLNFNADMKHILSSVLFFQSEIRKTFKTYSVPVFTLKIYINNLIFHNHRYHKANFGLNRNSITFDACVYC